MKPMIAAVGPRMMPKQTIEHTIETIPMTRAAIASPSVLCAAYPAPGGMYPPGGGGGGGGGMSDIKLLLSGFRRADLETANDPRLHRQRVCVRKHNAYAAHEQPERRHEVGGDQHKASNQCVDQGTTHRAHDSIDPKASGDSASRHREHDRWCREGQGEVADGEDAEAEEQQRETQRHERGLRRALTLVREEDDGGEVGERRDEEDRQVIEEVGCKQGESSAEVAEVGRRQPLLARSKPVKRREHAPEPVDGSDYRDQQDQPDDRDLGRS